jgi:hypothetical protein
MENSKNFNQPSNAGEAVVRVARPIVAFALETAREVFAVGAAAASLAETFEPNTV